MPRRSRRSTRSRTPAPAPPPTHWEGIYEIHTAVGNGALREIAPQHGVSVNSLLKLNADIDGLTVWARLMAETPVRIRGAFRGVHSRTRNFR